MATSLPQRRLFINLLEGRNPNDIYVCQIDDRTAMEEWVRNPDLRPPHQARSNWCAVCCTRMILQAESMYAPSREELFEAAQDLHAYQEIVSEDRETLLAWKGAYHEHLAIFLWRSLGLWAQAERNVDLNFLRARLYEGYYVLASVHPDIRFPDQQNEPEKKGGHFVLIYGFEIIGDACWFLAMNSSGFASQQSQIAVRVPNYRLRQLFSGNVVLVGSSQCVHVQNRPQPRLRG